MSGEFVDIDVVSRAQGCLLGQLDGDALGSLAGSLLPHQGYRNLGRRPIDTVNTYLESVKKEA